MAVTSDSAASAGTSADRVLKIAFVSGSFDGLSGKLVLGMLTNYLGSDSKRDHEKSASKGKGYFVIGKSKV